MRTGVFGGSFDPPHFGHLVVAEQVRQLLVLDRLIWIPAAVSPHKRRAPGESPRHRAAMVDLAISGNASFMASDRELERGGPSYTVDTLESLRVENPEDELFLIMGSDSRAGFSSWRQPERIVELATVVVYPRHGYPVHSQADPRHVIVDAPRTEVSSSFIRSRVRMGASIRYLVPDSVQEYIRRHGLYTG